MPKEANGPGRRASLCPLARRGNQPAIAAGDPGRRAGFSHVPTEGMVRRRRWRSLLPLPRSHTVSLAIPFFSE